jgi:hypothetical protein
MNYPVFRHTITLVGIVLLASFALGCSKVVVPVSPLEATITDKNHGFLFGAIHLTQNEKDLSAGLEGPMYMKWWLQEETHGGHILLSRLPLDGPFAVKLPTGSYRVTDVSFHTRRGVWHTELPTAFSILSRECTSLGMWKLELEEGFRAGWITRQVSDEKALGEGDFGKTFEAKSCPNIVASLDPEGKHSVRLSLRSRGDFDRP